MVNRAGSGTARPRSRDRTGHRGQLLLAGSVAIAVAVLGAAVLLNAAMYTDSVASADTPRSVAAAERYERTVETDLRRLVADTDNVGALRRNVTAYDERMALAAARSASASLEVALVDSSPSSYTFSFSFVTPDLDYRTTMTVARP